MFDTMLGRDIQQTLKHFRRAMDQAFGDFYVPSGFRGPATEKSEWTFTPAVETGCNDECLNLRVVLPGVSAGDVRVQLHGKQLVVEGERREPANVATNGGSTLLPYGSFHRAIDLPDGLNKTKIRCRLHDGMLDVQLPIAETIKPRQVAIQSSESRKAIAA
jgi:HSP20 family protein